LGRCAERVFWRHAAARGWPVSGLCHAVVVMGSLLANCIRPSEYLHLLGRIVSALGGPGCCRKHGARLRKAAELLERDNRAGEESDSGECAGPSSTTVRSGIMPQRLAA
jgi:hypothetical protein